MEYTILGWPPDGPALRLDHEEFAYAGKFVMTNTGKAVAREQAASDDKQDGSEDDRLVAAVAFNEDRTDAGTLWLRYVTVRSDRRGDGIGPHLTAFVRERARDRGYDRVQIAVNNPFAYEALYKAGFAYIGEETGMAELILSDTTERSHASYQDGLNVFRDRDLSQQERSFLATREETAPPDSIDYTVGQRR